MSRVWEVPVHDSTRVRDARTAVREACGQAGLGPERTAAGELAAAFDALLDRALRAPKTR